MLAAAAAGGSHSASAHRRGPALRAATTVVKETKHLAQALSTYLRRVTSDTIAHSKPIWNSSSPWLAPTAS